MFSAIGSIFSAIASIFTALNTTANAARFKAAEVSKNVRDSSGMTKEEILEEEKFFD